jgi:hypothetical protein
MMKKLIVSLFCIVVLTMGLSAGEKKIGLFPVCYEIGKDMAGAPHLSVQLLVNAPEKSVSGYSLVGWTVNPPVAMKSKLTGDFTYMTVMPKNTHILVVLTGYPIIKWPVHGGVGPVILPNLHARIVLTEDWKSGTANFSFIDNNGKWQECDNVPVKQVECFK